MGVALTSVVTRRPSGTDSVISSAGTVSALLIYCAIGNVKRLLQRAPRPAQGLDDPPRLPVERHEPAAPAVEDDDAYRASLDQPKTLPILGARGRAHVR